MPLRLVFLPFQQLSLDFEFHAFCFSNMQCLFSGIGGIYVASLTLNENDEAPGGKYDEFAFKIHPSALARQSTDR